MVKIGITFSVPDSPMDIFSNGIRQNIMFLRDTLHLIGYDVYLIVDNLKSRDVTKLYGTDSTYKLIDHSQLLNEGFDLNIQMGYTLLKDELKLMRNKGIKLVVFKSGNEYVFNMESILFNAECTVSQYDLDYPAFDEIWTIPQHMNTNKHYLETLLRTKCVEVPCIWSPSLLEHYEKECIEKGIGVLTYKNRGKDKKCAIFEPNRNVVKWCFPPLLVCENACRINPVNIKHIYVTNVCTSNKRFNKDYFNNLAKSLDLYKTKKISIEARYNSLEFMARHSDIAVSHQWENAMNYLYLDLAWMGWPLVHNAHLCKDIGYYYEGFNYEMGGTVLSDVIQNHDKNAENYMAKNRAAIDRYLPTNKDLQNKYKEVIENVLRK